MFNKYLWVTPDDWVLQTGPALEAEGPLVRDVREVFMHEQRLELAFIRRAGFPSVGQRGGHGYGGRAAR